VAAGRKEFLRQFRTIACPESDPFVAHPGEEKTFLQSKLDLSEREKHGDMYALHRDLLTLRRKDPIFSGAQRRGLDGAVLGPEAFVLRFFGEAADDRLLLVNFGLDLHLCPAPEPLLAPAAGRSWDTLWSSESPCYAGSGTWPLESNENWRIPGHAAVVLSPVKPGREKKGKCE
jgi:maltooligosyltrehalose trehalohydrolase